MTHDEHQVLLSKLMQAEETQRQKNAKAHRGPCVPWRGAGGLLGACIYCNKPTDPITQYYTDRANGHHAALARS